MAATNKITNKLFVWGSVASGGTTDLANIDYSSETGVAPGEESGNLIYASKYNSVGRNASLIPYMLIEILKQGPYGQKSGESYNDAYKSTWDEDIPTFDVDYRTANVDIATIASNLRDAFNQYLRYGQTYRAVEANVWTTTRTFKTSDGTHDSSTVNVNGSGDVTIPLPSTITASLDGTASNATTTSDTSNELYLVGVTSSATTTLKRNTGIKMKNGTLTASGLVLNLTDKSRGLQIGSDGTISSKSFTYSSPSAGSSDAIQFIATVSQDAYGQISATKQSVRAASDQQSGVVTTSTQTFAGAKTFTAALTCGSTITANSDKRLKSNIKSYTCKKSILDLNIYQFNYISDNVHSIGCIAQELQKICPDIVHKDKDGYLAVEDSKVAYLLLEEVKKLRKEVDELKEAK